MPLPPDILPTVVVDLHHLAPDATEMLAAIEQMRRAFGVPGTGTFIGDNLITFGKNLTFVQDKDFMAAYQAARPDRKEQATLWRKHTLYWAAKSVMALPGDFVEAACYRGFTARVICNALDLAAAGKRFWLYDVFDAPPGDAHAMAAHSDTLYEEVRQRFAGAPATVVRGTLPGALDGNSPARIALLHLDMNDAASEIGTLEALYDRICPGGIIILDDFGWAAYRRQCIAHVDWFAARGLAILEMPTGQGMVIKR